MPKPSCFIVTVEGHLDTFHTTECHIAKAREGREHGFYDNTMLSEAVRDWVNGLIDDKIHPNKIEFCLDCNPQLEN